MRSPLPHALPMPSVLSRSFPKPDRRTPVALAAVVALAAAAPAQLRFDQLRKRHLPAGHAHALALGDVDGDGDLDLATGDAGQNRLYLNDGTDVFTDATATHMPVDGDETRALAMVDVDGDGDSDLVIGNAAGQQNRLYLNDGSGSFTDVTAMRLPNDNDSTLAVAAGDVDGDGDNDVVLGNDGQNRLYLNDGTGTFADVTATRIPVDGDETNAVAIGDVDRDGDLDVIAGNGDFYGARNRLYVNDGAGAFADATAARMPAVASNTFAVVLGDVDGDGDRDLVCANGGFYGGRNRLYLNDGTGAFVDGSAGRMPLLFGDTTSVAMGDVDGDGDIDLAFGNVGRDYAQNRLYVNDGAGTFTNATAARLPADNDLTRAVAIEDVDRDGDDDIVFGGFPNRLYLNDGSGTFVDATRSTRVPVVLDFANDLVLGDVDGDGDDDLVSASEYDTEFCEECGQNRLYLNDGRGTFTDESATRLPARNDDSFAVALGDMDGDGDRDLVFGNDFRSRLYLNDGTGTFTDATLARMPAGVFFYNLSVAVGDVDGDGDLDIVFGNGVSIGNEQNRLFLNDGTGTFTDVTAASMPADNDRTRALALGDVDGDGDVDIVCGNGRFGVRPQNRLYLNDGNGQFTDATGTRMPVRDDDTFGLALGDVDGDDDLDLVVANGGFGISRQDRLYLNDGSGTFTDVTAMRLPVDDDGTQRVALPDVDADGDLDVVFVGSQNRLYLNDGSGFFSDATADIPSGSGNSLAIGDVDADGDPDLALGGRLQIRVELNLFRQLDVPLLVRPGRRYWFDVYSRRGPSSTADVAQPFVSDMPASVPLPPFGTFGLDPLRLLLLPPVQIPQPAGVATIGFSVPNVPSLVGARLYGQAVLAQSAARIGLTNVTADEIEDR